MNPRHAICLAIDGLRASALGTYGNSIYPTPFYDSLASRSRVVDWLWADAVELSSIYRSVWQGIHACRPGAETQTSLIEQLASMKIPARLITDDPDLAAKAQAFPFDAIMLLETGGTQRAEEIEDTALASFFAQAGSVIEEITAHHDFATQGSLTWLHSRGMFGAWDAPAYLREELTEEDGLRQVETVDSPKMIQADDPDICLAYRVAYAAQALVLDRCMEAMLESLTVLFPAEQTMLALFGPRGFATGEHGEIGSDCHSLYSEQIHLPLLIHNLGEQHPVQRCPAVHQPADLYATLSEWFQVPGGEQGRDGNDLLHDENTKLRGLAVCQGVAGERSLITPSWFLRQASSSASEEQILELFTQPDDYWQHNDVVERCPEVAQQLTEVLEQFLRRAETGDSLESESLVSKLDEVVR